MDDRNESQAKSGGKRQRRGREQVAALLQAYRAGGLSQEQFAVRAGIKVGTLRSWLYRGRGSAGGPDRKRAPGGFAPVMISTSGSGVATLSVRWPRGRGGVELEVNLGEDAAVALVRELIGSC